MKNFKQIQYLNTLVRMNNDRLAMYTNAAHLLQQFPVALDSAPFFAQLSRECLQTIRELSKEIKSLGGLPVEEPSLVGKMLLVWMETRAIFSSNPVPAVLNCCDRMDRIVTRSYYHVIRNGNCLSDDMRQRLLNQRINLESARNLMASYQSLQSSYMRQHV